MDLRFGDVPVRDRGAAGTFPRAAVPHRRQHAPADRRPRQPDRRPAALRARRHGALAMARARSLALVIALVAWWPGAGGGAGLDVTFAVIGDNGTGKAPQYDVARQMVKTHAETPFELVLMVGDNMYGSQAPRDFVDKFEIPYGPLLRMGIPFYAALGNHDHPENRHYSSFNMSNQRYYTFTRG